MIFEKTLLNSILLGGQLFRNIILNKVNKLDQPISYLFCLPKLWFCTKVAILLEPVDTTRNPPNKPINLVL